LRYYGSLVNTAFPERGEREELGHSSFFHRACAFAQIVPFESGGYHSLSVRVPPTLSLPTLSGDLERERKGDGSPYLLSLYSGRRFEKRGGVLVSFSQFSTELAVNLRLMPRRA